MYPYEITTGLNLTILLAKTAERNYDAYTGRWIGKDLILFASGDVNLYGYVMIDPVIEVATGAVVQRMD